jgi:hypothetical protein
MSPDAGQTQGIVYLLDGSFWRCLAVLPLDRALRYARINACTFAAVMVTWDNNGRQEELHLGHRAAWRGPTWKGYR